MTIMLIPLVHNRFRLVRITKKYAREDNYEISDDMMESKTECGLLRESNSAPELPTKYTAHPYYW